MPLNKRPVSGIHGFMDQPHIKLHIENKNPVDLADFTRSLEAFSNEYRRYMADHGYAGLEESRLYVHKIEAGSIDVILAAAMEMLPFVRDGNQYFGFINHIKSYMDYFLGRGEKPDDINVKTCQNIHDLQDIITSNPGSSYSISLERSAVQNLTVNYNFIEANGTQGKSLKEIEAMKAPTGQTHKGVLFGWSQVKKGRGITKGNTGDKGIIDSLSDTALSVYFDENSGTAKEEMSAGQENPLNQSYIVDVELLSLRGKPKAFKILKLHKVI